MMMILQIDLSRQGVTGGCVLKFSQITLPTAVSISSSSQAYQTTGHVSGGHSNTFYHTSSENIFIVKGMSVTGTGISGTVTVSGISGTSLTLHLQRKL